MSMVLYPFNCLIKYWNDIKEYRAVVTWLRCSRSLSHETQAYSKGLLRATFICGFLTFPPINGHGIDFVISCINGYVDSFA